MATSVNERRYLGEVIGRDIDLEALTVPTTGIADRYYIATLVEVPGTRPEVSRNLTISSTIDMNTPLRQITNRLPRSGEFVLQGQDVYFHESAAGTTMYARYVGIGTIVRAEDVETLKTRVVALEQAVEAAASAGTVIQQADSAASGIISEDTIVKYTGATTNGRMLFDILVPAGEGQPAFPDEPYGITTESVNPGGTTRLLVYGVRSKSPGLGTAKPLQRIYSTDNGSLTFTSTDNKQVGNALNDDYILYNMIDRSLLPDAGIIITVIINRPTAGSSFFPGELVLLSGTASTDQGSDLTSSINWSSNIDGNLGTGGTTTTSSLTIGTHTITASATDQGVTGESTVTPITVSAFPIDQHFVAILSPADHVTGTTTTNFTFTGVSRDSEGTDLAAEIRWTSNIDGVLNTGAATFQTTLSAGNHTVTALTRDSAMNSASDTVRVTVQSG